MVQPELESWVSRERASALLLACIFLRQTCVGLPIFASARMGHNAFLRKLL